jgi:hypothetical protein
LKQRQKKQKQKTRHLSRTQSPSKASAQKVKGYWRVYSDGTTRHVKGYTRKLSKLVVKKRKAEAKKLKVKLPKLEPGWKRYIDSGIIEQRYYTFKMEVLVNVAAWYPMLFTSGEIKKAEGETLAISYYHTPFRPTIQEAIIELRQSYHIFKARADDRGDEVKYIYCDLYKVSGEGPLREKHWQLLSEYDEPLDVPGF